MMGTTVWTTPNSARFHLNRRDIVSTDRNHGGCHKSPVDYRGGCARIEIDVGAAALTASDNFQQRLSLYDAECTINGDGVSLRCFISSQRDLLAVEVDDQREQPMDIRVTLSMWRDGVELHCKRLSESTEEIECTSGRMKILFHRESLEGDAWTNLYLARITDQALVVKQDEFGIAAVPPVAGWWITTLWNRFLLVVRNDK